MLDFSSAWCMVQSEGSKDNSCGVTIEHGADVADRPLLQRLEEMCPPRLSMVDDFETDWSVTAVPKNTLSQEGIIMLSVDSPIEDDWHEVTLSGSQVVQRHSKAGAAEARNAALGIQKELQWYFQERDSRLLGWRRDPVRKACARTVFARKLARFAASALHSADESLLEAWCMYLREIVEERVFSASNLIWSSRFERSLEACLARLERVLTKVMAQEFPELPTCPVDQQVVARAMERRDMVGKFTCVPLERLVVWKQLTKVDQVLTKVQTYCPLALPGLESAALLNSWTASIVFTTMCVEVLAQLAAELRAYSTGEIDGRTFLEDMLVASGSAGAFALGRYTAAFMCVGEGAVSFLADQFGAGCAAFFMGVILRAAGREMQGGPRMRALQNAHAALGLNPSGVWTYNPEEIESQLECRLRRQNRTKRSTLRLWAAFAYIREHQYPELHDPWRHVSAVWEGVADINYYTACDILHMDSQIGFTAAELRRRYLQQSLTCHPDKPTGDQETFMRLHGAYEYLRAFAQN